MAPIPEEWKNFPLTNLVGENAFGDFDFQQKKCRNAKLFHHSTLHMAKRNNVSGWLDDQSPTEQAFNMKKARKKAKPTKKEHRQREKDVSSAVRKKLMAQAAASIEAEIKAARLRQKLIEDVAKHGGPCRKVEDVEDLKDRLKGGELTTAVKNEIRYQKTELKVPGSLQLTKQ